ncbi:glycosyltransferase [Komagataeibacter sucrofermentans]|uniref:Glycosyl transferase n=1 Tax=Komagataeibacter sucrofermentans TaxID=1053551 RepID=A0A318QK61_9PROT|nr:glycosyltransferase [Komagataeibacter sucrofermentans]PYD78810.1 glycosyl transferase [Komagataeibacter sucrofermentans]GBQ49285.1 glycosyltransferase [Komagataeibacter sucrofermentans DSM 15973]
MQPDRPLVAAIPVRNEAERIGPCLLALGRQHAARLTHVVVLLNNCTDATLHTVQAISGRLPFALHVVERTYPPLIAHAGTARRAAMTHAAELAGPEGIMLTTDADAVVAPDWLDQTLAAFAKGADAVCGRALIDPVEAACLPACLHDDDRAETAYATMLDRIHDLADPDLHDPWPRHVEHSGASIAVRAGPYHRAGGIPAVPLGEDRRFLAALRRVDAAIRHAPDVWVSVSGRVAGRARGGMADTMARRLIRQDEMLDENLEPAMACLHRAQARAALRPLWGHPMRHGPWRARGEKLARQLMLPATALIEVCAEPFFGLAWDRLVAASPLLRRHPVRRAGLVVEHQHAARIVRRLLHAQAPVQPALGE